MGWEEFMKGVEKLKGKNINRVLQMGRGPRAGRSREECTTWGMKKLRHVIYT